MGALNSVIGSRGDALYDFAMEPDPGDSLQRYVNSYPQYKEELEDLCAHLLEADIEEDGPLSDLDMQLVDKSWAKFVNLS